MTFKLEITSSKKISYLLEFVKTSRFRYTHSSHYGDRLCLFLRRTPTVGSPRKLEIIRSLPLLFSSSLISLSYFFPLFHLSPGLVKLVQVECPLLPHVAFSLALLDFPYPLIQFSKFPSSQVVTRVPHGSHLDICLTCSPFDTWLHMSHPTYVKCHSSLSVPQKT